MPSRKGFYIASDTPRHSPTGSPLPSSMPSPVYPLSPKLGPSPVIYSPHSYHSHSHALSGGPYNPHSSSSGIHIPRPIRRPKQIIYLAVIFFLLYWFGIRHGLGLERVPPPPLGYAVKGGGGSRRGRGRTISWSLHGMASLLPLRPNAHPEHPIYELMERAEDRWNRLLASQSTTLESAVAEYKRRYRMPPPAGFDDWFAFCQRHGVVIVDDYDELMRDIIPHHALSPELFVSRARALQGEAWTYTLDISKSNVDISGPASGRVRPTALRDMVEGFREELPEGFKLTVTGSDHDAGSIVLGEDQRQRAMELVEQNMHFTPEELRKLEDPNRTPAWGWFKACPMNSPANIRPWAENATDEIEPKSFIYDHLPTMDFCEFPELKRLHGAFHMDKEDRSPSRLTPILVHSKMPGDRSFLLAPTEGYGNVTAASLSHHGSWAEKTDNRVHWRGSTTGGFNTQRDWKESHRMRLHLMVNGPKGGDKWWDSQVREVMLPDGTGGYTVVRRWERILSRAYADVKLAGELVQCPSDTAPELCKEVERTIEFADHVWPKDAKQFKYILDVDGNGWSSRFHRVLTTGSPVIKMTMFADWHMSWLTPWYHYIPLKPDYSDLYDIMAFFVGPMEESGEIDESKGHDYLARKIGDAGQRFALEHWRWEDMQAYTYRLFLELARLHSLDRESATYRDVKV